MDVAVNDRGNIEVTSKTGFRMMTIYRRSEGWRCNPNSATRKISRTYHTTAHQAAKSYLKGETLKRVRALGNQIDVERWGEIRFELTKEVQNSRYFEVKFDEDGAQPCINAAVLWCRDQFGAPFGTIGGDRASDTPSWGHTDDGIWFKDDIQAMNFRLRWC